jgi:hypothetical protein
MATLYLMTMAAHASESLDLQSGLFPCPNSPDDLAAWSRRGSAMFRIRVMVSRRTHRLRRRQGGFTHHHTQKNTTQNTKQHTEKTQNTHTTRASLGKLLEAGGEIYAIRTDDDAQQDCRVARSSAGVPVRVGPIFDAAVVSTSMDEAVSISTMPGSPTP